MCLVIALLIFFILLVFLYREKPTCSYKTKGAKLWNSHVALTRLYIIEAVAGLGSASSTLQLLMKNQEDIGKHFGKIYGKKIGEEFTSLLKEHITVAGQIVQNAASGKDVSELENNWHANGDKIVALLHKANPKINLKKLWDMHLSQTTEEAVFIIKKQYPQSAEKYLEIVDCAFEMAKEISK